MAPELFRSWENDSVPAKTLASDVYAMGHVTLEVGSFVPGIIISISHFSQTIIAPIEYETILRTTPRFAYIWGDRSRAPGQTTGY